MPKKTMIDAKKVRQILLTKDQIAYLISLIEVVKETSPDQKLLEEEEELLEILEKAFHSS